MSTMTTGKVKEMAASWSVPSRETKRVSARLKPKTARMPTVIGTARRSSAPDTGPCVRSTRAKGRHDLKGPRLHRESGDLLHLCSRRLFQHDAIFSERGYSATRRYGS